WLLENNKNQILDNEEKHLFATLIAIQFLRMPNIRYKYVEADKKFYDKRLEIIKAYINTEIFLDKEISEDLDISYDNEDFASAIHAEIFADEELLLEITNLITSKHWVFYVTSSKDFYTSDNPIFVKSYLPNQKTHYEGFGMKGAEIIFPLGSSVLLTLWDENYFNEKQNMADNFHCIDANSKIEYNRHQYLHATKQIYSEKDNFDLIREIKSINGGKEIFIKSAKILVNGK
ncbi:DUF4238 domain-containing protein, partial [bacterium]